MRNCKPAVLIASLYLSACGGGGSSGSGINSTPTPTAPPASTISITGVVSKGLVTGATVTAYCGGQASGTAFGSPATTDANGNYSITSTTTCSSPVELIAASGSATTELDEATGLSIPVSFTALKAYLATVGATNVQHITPLTHIVATELDSQTGVAPTSSSVQAAISSFVSNVLDGDSATFSAAPMPPAQALASLDTSTLRLASLLTGLSAEANALGSTHGTNGIRDPSAGTAAVLEQLTNAATGGTANSSAMNSAIVVLLASDLSVAWSGGAVTDPSAMQLIRLSQAVPVFSPQAAGSGAFSIGGTVSGLTGTGLVLQDNLGESLPVSANGPYTFVNSASNGIGYVVRVASEPSGQACSVSNGAGVVSSANINNVAVSCVPGYTLGGAVSGLAADASLTLSNNNGDFVTVTSNSTFTFPTALVANASFSVSVATQPAGQHCTVAQNTATGSMGSQNNSNIAVSCANTYGVSVNVSGLDTGNSVTVKLYSSGLTEYVTATQNGVTPFATGLPNGTVFTISISADPQGQGCSPTTLPTPTTGSFYEAVGGGTISGPYSAQIVCADGFYTVGGTVSGLAAGNTLVLEDDTALATGGPIGDSESLAIHSNGPYHFVAPVLQMNPDTLNYGVNTYTPSILQQPTNQNCVWEFGPLTIGPGTYTYTVLNGNVTSLNILCTAAYLLTGTVIIPGGGYYGGLVTITGTVPFPGSTSDSQTANLNPEGQFQLVVPPGTYTVAPYTNGGLETYSPVSLSVVVGDSNPSPVSFTCVSGCGASGGGGSGSSGGGSSGGGSSGGGSGSGGITCPNGSTCVSPLSATCVNAAANPNDFNIYYWNNNCGQAIYITYTENGGGGLSLNIPAGGSASTGTIATNPPTAFLYVVCPAGYYPLNENNQTPGNINPGDVFTCVSD